MNSKSSLDVKEVSKLVSESFITSNGNSIIKMEDFSTLQEFKIYLSNKLKDLLDNNYELLINTLYRIDIEEDKLMKLFSSHNKEYIPAALADLIIERQLKKIEWRTKYKKGII